MDSERREKDMKQQRGGTFLGFIIGVIVGLGAALAVAVYVTKVPMPFMNKGQTRSAEQDEAEAKKNKNWDPNAPLYGKNPVKAGNAAVAVAPAAPASSRAVPPPVAVAKAAAVAKNSDKSEAKPDSKGDPKAEAKADPKPAVTADPLGDLAKAKLNASEPFNYFVQVGAYRNSEDADVQRAKLSLSGVSTKISEREQAGQVVFRLRQGPFDKKEDAEKAKVKLDALGLETALVRVQR